MPDGVLRQVDEDADHHAHISDGDDVASRFRRQLKVLLSGHASDDAKHTVESVSGINVGELQRELT